VDLFLEYLRKQTESSDETKRREKKELAEQIQRNADKRNSDLQQTRLQMIADSRQMQDRRAQLDAADDRKALRRQELDRKELDARLDQRMDQKQRDLEKQSEKLWEPPQTLSDDVERLEPERSNESAYRIGIARQAAMDAETFRPENVSVPETDPFPLQTEQPKGTTANNDPSQMAQTLEKPLMVERGFAEYRPKTETAADTAGSTNSSGRELVKTDAAETGRQMQMLASFSDLSGKLAFALKQPGSGSSVTGNPRPGFTNLRESAERSKDGQYNDPSSEAGLKLDLVPLEKRPRKALPEFFAMLDAALGVKGRKKSDSSESGQDHFPSQSQQADSQHGLAAKKTDRPMLDQLERVRLVQRVANACLSVSNQGGTIRIKLHPETLGSVSVKIKTKDKTMNISLETETESAKTVLLENADDLKRQLQKHGRLVESFSVQVRG